VVFSFLGLGCTANTSNIFCRKEKLEALQNLKKFESERKKTKDASDAGAASKKATEEAVSGKGSREFGVASANCGEWLVAELSLQHFYGSSAAPQPTEPPCGGSTANWGAEEEPKPAEADAWASDTDSIVYKVKNRRAATQQAKEQRELQESLARERCLPPVLCRVPSQNSLPLAGSEWRSSCRPEKIGWRRQRKNTRFVST